MAAIAIYWEEYFPSEQNKTDREKNLYLIFSSIRITPAYELVYLGTKIDNIDLYIQSAGKKEKVKIYKGILHNTMLKQAMLSQVERNESIKKAESLLINILEYPSAVHRIRNVGKDTVSLVNFNIKGILSNFITNKEYFWKDELRYDIVRAMSIKFNKKIVFEEAFYGFFINDIFCGIDAHICDSTEVPMVIRINRCDLVLSARNEENIKEDFGVKILSNYNECLILLGGINAENIDTSIQEIKLIVEKITQYITAEEDYQKKAKGLSKKAF